MSSCVFSLLFKVLLNSTLSWWKSICFVGLVLLWLSSGLGKQQSRCSGASGTGSSWGGRKRDWSTWQAAGLPLLGSGCQPSWGKKALAGWEVLRWRCSWTHTSSVAQTPRERVRSVFRKYFQTSPTPISLAWVLLILHCFSQLHAFSLFSPVIRTFSFNPVLSFLVFPVSSCGSLMHVVTFLASPLETPSHAPLLIFKGLFQVSTSICFPGFSLLHLWTTSSRNRNGSHYCTNYSQTYCASPALSSCLSLPLPAFKHKKLISNIKKARNSEVTRLEGQSFFQSSCFSGLLIQLPLEPWFLKFGFIVLPSFIPTDQTSSMTLSFLQPLFLFHSSTW